MTTTASEPTARDLALRRAFSVFPTGVVALAAVIDGRPVGMAVNSFTSISLEPALVAVSAARSSRTWPVLATAGQLGMSVLGAGQESLSRRLSSRTETDRFGEHAYRVGTAGAVLLEGSALGLTCAPYRTYDGGDHIIALYEILEVELFDGVEPLVFHESRYKAIQRDPVSV